MKKLALLLVVAGCASEPPPPAGPGLLVLPGTGKSFDLFMADDRECRQFASSQVSGSAAQQSDTSSRSVQQRYDFGYTQCMYAKGHRVPVAGRYSDGQSPRRSASGHPPPPPPPPPPEGKPPGPPPDYMG
jgi:hypothetical protein